MTSTQNEFYELNLETFPADSDQDLFKLTLSLKFKSQTGTRDFSQILQKDSVIPPGRPYPRGYKIESVYMYRDLIAVFINIFTPGFESTAVRYMVVTGQLKQ